jgi:hypothetical protein
MNSSVQMSVDKHGSRGGRWLNSGTVVPNVYGQCLLVGVQGDEVQALMKANISASESIMISKNGCTIDRH